MGRKSAFDKIPDYRLQDIHKALAEGNLSIRKIAEKYGVSPSSVQRLKKRLEEAGEIGTPPPDQPRLENGELPDWCELKSEEIHRLTGILEYCEELNREPERKQKYTLDLIILDSDYGDAVCQCKGDSALLIKIRQQRDKYIQDVKTKKLMKAGKHPDYFFKKEYGFLFYKYTKD